MSEALGREGGLIFSKIQKHMKNLEYVRSHIQSALRSRGASGSASKKGQGNQEELLNIDNH